MENKTFENQSTNLKSLREKNKIQERAAFHDESVLSEVGMGERRKASVEEKKSMDKNLEKLADIFEGSNIHWQLDGALNISLMNNNEYIGVHKDVDVTIDPDDLGKLEKQLFEKNYGLFLSSRHEEDINKRKMTG